MSTQKKPSRSRSFQKSTLIPARHRTRSPKTWLLQWHDPDLNEWLYIECVEECGSEIEGLVITPLKKEASRFTLKAAFKLAEEIRKSHPLVNLQVKHAWTKEEIPVSAL